MKQEKKYFVGVNIPQKNLGGNELIMRNKVQRICDMLFVNPRLEYQVDIAGEVIARIKVDKADVMRLRQVYGAYMFEDAISFFNNDYLVEVTFSEYIDNGVIHYRCEARGELA